jgi:glycogen debranching enzyme
MVFVNGPFQAWSLAELIRLDRMVLRLSETGNSRILSGASGI